MQYLPNILNILIRDNASSELFPGAFIYLNGKSYKNYVVGFQAFYNVINGFGANKLNLKSITLDLEVALRTSIAIVFGKIDFISCLFHIKQAWYRQAQRLDLS